MKKTIFVLLILSGCGFITPTEQTKVHTGSPKNIIVMIGDGMGPSYTTAYRYFNDDQTTDKVERTIFDRLLVGMASTSPANVDGYITDSAASATALATGVKTYNKAIAVDVNKQPIENLFEKARKAGKNTGLVVTSSINHATPAAFMVHNESRYNNDDLADAYFDERANGQFKADVMLGGGLKYFKRDDRDLVTEFSQAGYQTINTMEQLANLDYNNKKVLGLFANDGLPARLNDKNNNRLQKQAVAAIRLLEKEDKGFVLLIEGSQIDWAGHDNNIASVMAEMNDFAETMEWVEQYVKDNPDTLMIATADHNTGGMTLSSGEIFDWQPHWLKNISMSPYKMAKSIVNGTLKLAEISTVLGFNLTNDEINALETARNLGTDDLDTAIKKLLDLRTNTGWTTVGHTAVDVQVFAKGVKSEIFSGAQDNTDIGEKLLQLLD